MSSAVVKLLAPSPAIGLPATLKPLSGPNIVSFPTPAKETTSVLLPSSSPLMMSLFLAQGILAPSTFLSGAVVEPFILPATQSTSLTPLLDLAMKSPAQDENQHQSIFVPVSLPSPGLDPLERPANRPTIELATNPDPNTL